MIPKDWKKLAISEVATVKTGKTPSSKFSGNFGDSIPFVTPGDLGTTKYICNANRFLSNKALKKAVIIPKGAVLFVCIGSTIGKMGISACKLSTNQQINSAIPKNINSDFLFYSLNYVAQQIKKIAGVQAVPIINKTTFENQIITVPIDLSQQKNIASILSTWDEAIEKTEKLIELKEKKFKSFSNSLLFGKKHKSTKATKWFKLPNHWKLLKIKDFAKEVKEKNGSHKDIPVLSCTKYDGLVDSLKYFDKRIYSENTSQYKLVKEGYFAYATNHIEEGSIGYQDLYPVGLVSPMYTVFKTNDSIDDGYLYKLLKTETFRHIFEVNTSASVDRRGSLRWNYFSKLPIPFPPLEEQTKINKTLQASKAEIDLLKKILDTYKTQKRGLMQKLLTGKWQVKTLRNKNA